MMTPNQIQYIANYLKDKLSYLNEYTNAEYDCPGLSRDIVNGLKNTDSIVQAQIRLKYAVSELLNRSFNNSDVNRWIISDWGHIRKFKSYGIINKFGAQLMLNRYSGINRISSLSKVASFVAPDDYFVYDSRVAFSINGLLLKYRIDIGDTENLSFFEMPKENGRSQRTQIIKQLIFEKVESPVFIEDLTYNDYCLAIKELSSLVFENPSEHSAFEIEMLLFVLGKTNGIIEAEFEDYFRNAREESAIQTSGNTVGIAPDDLLELMNHHNGYSIYTNKTLPNGLKSIISCEISDGITLAVGKRKTFIFCGVYSNSPIASLPDMDAFDRPVKNGRYKKFKTNQMDLAVKQFSDILDTEIAKKSNQ